MLRHNKMEVVCYYDIDHCLLQRRTQVLSSVCGFKVYPEVVSATKYIQVHARTFLAHKHKRMLKTAMTNFSLNTRRFRQRHERSAVIRIQKMYRTHLVHTSTVGRLLKKIRSEQDNTMRLELLILSLTKRFGVSSIV